MIRASEIAMSRLSTIYRAGSGGASGRRIPQPVPQDLFPLLDFKEISVCLQSCDFIANEDLVSKPNSQYIRMLIEQILDSFMGLSVESIDIIARSLGKNGTPINRGQEHRDQEHRDQEVDGEEALNMGEDDEDDTLNTTRLIILHRGAQKFFQVCGISDFTLMDIMRPEPQRIRRILSAVVNYARFREENSVECERLVGISEVNIEKLKRKRADNDKLANQIQILRHRIEASEDSERGRKTTLKQINVYNHKLEHELKKMKKAQESLTLEHAKYKDEKNRLIEKLQDHNYLIIESNRELDKIKSYLLSDPSILTRLIDNLKMNLNEYQSNLSDLELKIKNITSTVESFLLVEQGLKNLFRILEEILNDIAKEENSLDKLNKCQDTLEQQNITLNNLERHIHHLTRQLSNMEEKMKRLRHQSNERSEQSKKKLSDLRESYDNLAKERNVKEHELYKKKEFISDLETKMNAERTNFQREMRNAELAVEKLNSHVRLYLNEMGKKI